MTRRRAIGLLISGMLVTLTAVALARLSFGLILPAMQGAFGLSYGQAGRLGTATALGYLAFVMVAGGLASRRGGRLSILIGLGCLVVGFFGLAVARDYVLLLVLMTLLGVGTAFSYTPLISLIGTWFAERRGLAIGLLNSGVGSGLFLAGAVVPALTSADATDGWRLAWAVFGAVALLATICVVFFLPNPPAVAGDTDAALTKSAAAESRPGLRREVFANPYVAIVGVVYAVVGLTYIVQAIFMFSYALAAGVDPVLAGRLAAAMGLIGIVAGPVWGTVSDRLGRAVSLALAMTMAGIATALPVIWPTVAGFSGHYLLLGASVTGMFTSVLAAATETVSPRAAPLAVSFVTMFFAAGQLVGPVAAGALIGEADQFRLTFGLSTACILAAGALALGLLHGRVRPSAAPAA